MKSISLTKGKFAKVDDEDFEELNKYKWCAGEIKGIWYAYRGKREGLIVKRISMHRLIMKAEKRWDIVDHINHDGLDNRKINLRIVTNSENLRNRKPKK